MNKRFGIWTNEFGLTCARLSMKMGTYLIFQDLVPIEELVVFNIKKQDPKKRKAAYNVEVVMKSGNYEILCRLSKRAKLLNTIKESEMALLGLETESIDDGSHDLVNSVEVSASAHLSYEQEIYYLDDDDLAF